MASTGSDAPTVAFDALKQSGLHTPAVAFDGINYYWVALPPPLLMASTGSDAPLRRWTGAAGVILKLDFSELFGRVEIIVVLILRSSTPTPRLRRVQTP